MSRLSSMARFDKCWALLDPSGRRKLVILGALILLNTLAEVVSVGLVMPFITLMNAPDQALASKSLSLMRQALGLSEPRDLLLAAGLGFLALIAAKNVLGVWAVSYQAHYVFGEAAATARKLLDRYLHAPYTLHLRRNSADLITTADASVDQVYTRALMGYLSAVTEGLVLAGIGLVLLATEPLVSALAGGLLGVIFAVFFRLLNRRMGHYGAQDIALRRDRLKMAQQSLSSVKEVKVCGREDFFLERFAALRAAHGRLVAITTTLQQLPKAVGETVVVAAIMLTAAVILTQGRQTQEVVAVLGLFAVAAFRAMPSLNRLIMALNNIRFARAALDAVHADFAGPIDRETPEGESGEAFAFKDSIRVDSVSFRYAPEAEPSLRAITLDIPRGASVGFVGSSGAGKSTLVDVILGLIPPESGKVLVDGRDIADHRRRWQRMIGYVPQAISILDDSIRDNVAFGLAAAEIDDAKVIKALELAQLSDFVAGLPQGLDTRLGERGTRLSGGQRQRVGIARALYHDPEVLVMDEATAALDTETERDVTLAIEGLRGTKTMLIIAHRLSTVRRCDRLALMAGGALVDWGSFDELMARRPEFEHIVRLAELVAAGPQDLSALT